MRLLQLFLFHFLYENRVHIPKSWLVIGRVEAATYIPGMTQSILDNSQDFSMEVRKCMLHPSSIYARGFWPAISSHPTSKRYDQHFYAEEFADISVPSQGAVETAHEWLVSADIAAEKTVACDQYHAPAHIKEYIDNITPGTNADFEKWKFGLASGIVNGGFPSPLLKEAWMTIQALVAIPELAICDSAITLVCKQTVHNVTEIFAPDFARS
ncbi:protease S8 tripeptidyl peptidase I (cln2) [Drepanopeziza brunnea f. sp. 'multigermtubi' MB_m1]|uniref:Protease S8 tripeptidyl peptidase I (Cln2) n=1 Tax=Marssonina brunnea f. sp. multigermtubi (strain MB_m1) TaxID=1072389 RepID=K1WZ80_MARBU|nr:protease S8 tripeptidyl peptidase I (cln2) [Drepanopeziza brunnea f. sp. 'multigermtubi' MB_m1]EKD18291.1 protease S8 tripeptidyl peptidase I (cln2) [Drepanopeziza brunnea f. sp. 'multigermtubi' MB_m1]